MMCQECGVRPATVHVTQVVNQNKTTKHLCRQCAEAQHELEFFLEPPISIHHLMSGFLEQAAEAGMMPGRRSVQKEPGNVCPGCGLTYRQFVRSGLLGCGQCYETFAPALEAVMRRVHGGTRHVGKRPTGKTAAAADDPRRQIAILEMDLQQALADERYEDAAKLRDQIRELRQRIAREG